MVLANPMGIPVARIGPAREIVPDTSRQTKRICRRVPGLETALNRQAMMTSTGEHRDVMTRMDSFKADCQALPSSDPGSGLQAQAPNRDTHRRPVLLA
jgi:hypothetical protein